MKVGQKTIVRWISKRVAKRSEPVARQSSLSPCQELDAEQLRQVSGGVGGNSQLPRVGW